MAYEETNLQKKQCGSKMISQFGCTQFETKYVNCREIELENLKKRPDTRAGGQGPYLRSPDYLGWGSEVKEKDFFKK